MHQLNLTAVTTGDIKARVRACRSAAALRIWALLMLSGPMSVSELESTIGMSRGAWARSLDRVLSDGLVTQVTQVTQATQLTQLTQVESSESVESAPPPQLIKDPVVVDVVDDVVVTTTTDRATQRTQVESSDSVVAPDTLGRMTMFGMPDSMAQDLLDRHGEQACERQCDNLMRQTNVQNQVGWLKTAIEENYEMVGKPLPERRPSRELGTDEPLLPPVEATGPETMPEGLDTEAEACFQAWMRVKEQVALQLTSRENEALVEPARFDAYREDEMVITVHNTVARDLFHHRLAPWLKEAMYGEIGHYIDIHIILRST